MAAVRKAVKLTQLNARSRLEARGTRCSCAQILLAGVAAAFALQSACAAVAADSSVGDLKGLSIEQLMNVEVTSVSKRQEPLGDAPAAIYVITHEDIIRSGATSIPEVLRLAPNLYVVQLSASNYIVTARGFSGNSADQNFSDKLLVLIDGRSVYSPLYSGVYWDVQDVVLDDVDRIEVISGPGATLWGANAVNGVINIITRAQPQGQSGEASIGAGNLEKNVSGQFGAQVGDGGSFRLYAKGIDRGALDVPDGSSAGDQWSKVQGGFRSDWQLGADSLTIQGDGYHGTEAQIGAPDLELAGGNVVAHWEHPTGENSSLQVKGYYDETQRITPGSGGFELNTYDVEVQQSLSVGSHNDIVWGAGDRITRYGITNTATFLFQPASGSLHLGNVFAQDAVQVTKALKLTIGVKLEHDPYSGTTPLPDARLSWRLNGSTLLWAAASRAIRSATPFDREVIEYLSNVEFLVGGANFKPERLNAYEVGYRGQVGQDFSVSVSTFFNRYDDLRSLEFNPTTLLPLQWGNMMEGETYGAEVWGNYRARDWWRLSFGFDELHENLRFKPGSSELLGTAQAGDDPSHQAFVRSSMDLGKRLMLDASFRYVGSLPNPAVPAYADLNLRLSWRLTDNWELGLSGFNLLHAHHVEFTAPPSDAISRSALLDVRAKL